MGSTVPTTRCSQEQGSDELTEYKHEESPQLSKTGEKLKVVLKKNNFSAFIQCLIHFPPVAITIGVLSLTFRSVFWAAPGPNSNSVLNALQFAAKVHESLIVVSLCSMVIHYLRRGLLGSRGVPLGLLTSGFQLTSVAYIFGAEFWGGVCSKGQRAVHRVPLVLAILAAFTLANLAAPSSAILMIPKLDWWSMGELWPGNQIVFSAYIQAPNDTLFPETVTKETLPDYCFEDIATSQNDCPSSGLQDIMTNAGFLSNTNPDFWSLANTTAPNITMQLLNTPAVRFLGGLPSLSTKFSNGVFAASSTPDFLASVTWQLYATLVSWNVPGSIKMCPLSQVARPLLRLSIEAMGQQIIPHKPAVQVECAGVPYGLSNIVFPHDRFMTSPWTDEAFLNADWSIRSSEISDRAVNLESGKVNFTWVALESHKIPKPSLAGIFVVPTIDSEGGTMNAVYACTVAANWVPTEPWIDPATDAFIHEALPDPFSDVIHELAGHDSTVPAYPPLYIQPAWADSLNIIYNAAGLNQTATEAIASACIASTGSAVSPFLSGVGSIMAQCLQMGLALYIADGLARMQSTIPALLVATGPGLAEGGYSENFTFQVLNAAVSEYRKLDLSLTDLHDPKQFARVRFEVLRYGYGYGFRGILIYMAVAVLLIHVILAIIHIGIVLARGLSVGAWSGMGEMMVLSLNSPNTGHLRNTCAGISKKETWGLITKVRETSDHHLELIVGENGEIDGLLLKPVKPGKSYG